MKLRQNWALQELVEAFLKARPAILKFAESPREPDGEARERYRKRKIEDTDAEDEEYSEEPQPRRLFTRSRRGHRSTPQSDADEFSVQQALNDEPNDGLAACPICDKRMKEEQVYSHLDVHNGGSRNSTKAQPTSRNSPYFAQKPDSRPPKAVERLPQINYSLLKDGALRKKMEELGIPSNGPRQLVIRRHTEWVNLVNANCDSKFPETKRNLLRDLDNWDKIHGRQLANGTATSSASVMSKDFDGNAWASNHQSNFKNLIAQARTKRQPVRQETSTDTHRSAAQRPENNEDVTMLEGSNAMDIHERVYADGLSLPKRVGSPSSSSQRPKVDQG
ncbi:uncharacterized protein KY384_007616 [Bacidia gigantensis]|uniref:uncharacterized protein n=1 Tax=Bacidia gigantensis TaxID=2732470 RepID=UPI001D03DE97|nr:uncharacterized protein KY384_007616 [Bacidia gigantensis]KAG8527464.1 hypothetical protein KY384_007616 [Bacidia gigantensis]